MSYRAGIIGAGGLAGLGTLGLHDTADSGEKKFETSHASGYGAVDGLDPAGVAETAPDRLATFGSAWDIPARHRFRAHPAMLETLALDVALPVEGPMRELTIPSW